VWDALDAIAAELGGITLVTGGASGADALAERWANNRGHHNRIYPAEWRVHGVAAGPIRNERMLQETSPVLVVAFPGGRGTADMVARARAAGVEVREVP
jgi:hypothetical protein